MITVNLGDSLPTLNMILLSASPDSYNYIIWLSDIMLKETITPQVVNNIYVYIYIFLSLRSP